MRAGIAAWTAVGALAGLFLAPGAHAQAACGLDPPPPSCVAPNVSVSLPSRVSASGPALFRGEASEVTAPVNVSYGSPVAPPGEQSTVSVVPKPVAGLSVQGGTGPVSPQQNVSIRAKIGVPPATPAGRYPVAFFVNTTATNVHRPSSQEGRTELVVPLWIRVQSYGFRTAAAVDGGIETIFHADALRANGPVDLLVTVDNGTHVVEPRRLGTDTALGRGEAVTREWTLRFRGAGTSVAFRVWPVVSQGADLACFDKTTFEPVPVADERPSDACVFLQSGTVTASHFTGQLGGLPGLVLLVSMGLALPVMAGAVALGVYVWRRGGHEAPARALAAYLVLHGITFGLLALRATVQELFGVRVADRVLPDWVAVLVLVTLLGLPAAILTFALSYPTLHPRLRGRPWWPALPALPSALVGLFLVASATLWPQAFELQFSFVFALLALVPFVTGLLFWQRARHGATELERRRLLYMLRFVAVPLAAAVAVMFALFVLDVTGVLPAWRTGIAFPVIAAVALLPVFGMAWGLLRYKVVDLNRGLRVGLSRGLVGAVFLAVFFALTEGAQVVLENQTHSALVGVAGAALLLLAIVPLERLGNRLASRVVRPRPDAAAYDAFRRLEVYRAAFEEVATDEDVTEREGRALAALAASLRLSSEEVSFVESEAARERAALRGAPKAGAVRSPEIQ